MYIRSGQAWEVAVDDVFGVVAARVWRYLEGDSSPSAAAWRALLRIHESGSDGSCARCQREHAGDACTVWQVAIGYFVPRS